MDWLEAVGNPELRSALAFVLAQAHAVTADELAAFDGTHRNVARSRLERLADAGLLRRGYERRSGRTGPGAGRPAKTYAAAPQLRSIEFPDRRYEKLVGLLLDSLPAKSRRQRLRALGIAYADDLLRGIRLQPAKTVAAAAERVCVTVRESGFHAAVAEMRDGVAVIETATCPLRPLVRERSSVAEIDRGMWSGLAARSLDVDPARIECDTHSCQGDGSCRITLAVTDSQAL
jgi:predicted ArsR family transcriptional regulator